MPPLLIAAILASGLATWMARGRLLIGGTTVLLSAVLVETVMVHLPLNATIERFSPGALPSWWFAARDRWRNWHWFRTALALAAFAMLTFDLAVDG
jgi:uncharacterized membrane protein